MIGVVAVLVVAPAAVLLFHHAPAAPPSSAAASASSAASTMTYAVFSAHVTTTLDGLSSRMAGAGGTYEGTRSAISEMQGVVQGEQTYLARVQTDDCYAPYVSAYAAVISETGLWLDDLSRQWA